jgi:type IV secretion system protein VirB10
MPNSPILDGRQLPPGVVPRHIQQWILVGIALVMIGILAVGGGSVKPKPLSGERSAGAGATDANQQRIEEYQRRIQEQAQRLAQEQAALAEAKQTVITSADVPASVQAPRLERRGSGSPESSVTTGRADIGSVRQEREQREYRSLFADSVAFTRDERHDQASRQSSSAEPPLPLSVAGLGTGSVTGTPSSAEALEPAPSVTTPPRTTDTVTAAPAPNPQPVPRSATGRATVPPPSEPRYTLTEGTILETVLTNRLDGTFAGPVNCLVTTAAYATDQQHLLIPAGSRVLGEARPVTAFGQARLAVVFHRLVLPNGTRVDLHEFHALNQGGDVGLQDQVNRHYAQIFGASLAVGAIAGLAQTQTAVGLDATSLDVYRQGAAANLAQSSARILDRFLNLLPTVTIREGHRVKVYLSNDLELPAYRESVTGPGGR